MVGLSQKRVFIESPFKGENWEATRRNVLYARVCVRDSVLRGEAPYASHLFFTQTGILDDSIPAERDLGIAAGQAYGDACALRAVYQDFGISRGMQYGIERAQLLNQPMEYRNIINLDQALREMANKKPPIDLGGLLF